MTWLTILLITLTIELVIYRIGLKVKKMLDKMKDDIGKEIYNALNR